VTPGTKRRGVSTWRRPKGARAPGSASPSMRQGAHSVGLPFRKGVTAAKAAKGLPGKKGSFGGAGLPDRAGGALGIVTRMGEDTSSRLRRSSRRNAQPNQVIDRDSHETIPNIPALSLSISAIASSILSTRNSLRKNRSMACASSSI
jgi:hypothetical protein